MSKFQNLSAAELADFHRRGEEAAQHFDATLEQLSVLARKYSPLEILARLAMTTITSQARFGFRDYDPALHVYHLEFFQAVALSEPLHPDHEDGAISDVTNEIIRLVNENSEAFRNRELRAATSDGRTNALNNLIDQVQVTTQTVRGARHAFQTRHYLRELAEEVDVDFERELGCTLSAFLDFIESIATILNERLEAFRARHRSWMMAPTIEKAGKLFGEANTDLAGSSEVREILEAYNDLTQVRYALLTLVEDQFAPIFRIPKPCEPALRGLVDRMSLKFGDVNRAEIARLHLDNPVWRKPFITLDKNDFFWPNPQSLFAFLVEIVDELTDRSPRLKARIEKAKSRWLEKKLGQILKHAFPSATVLTSVHWTGFDGVARETDAVVLIDKVIAIFEAKSGRVSPPARRGAQDRLRREIKRLIVEPSEQSEALRATLARKSLTVHCDQGTANVISADFRECLRVNILFDTIGTLSAHWPQLLEHELVDSSARLAPTMSVFELETIFDALPTEIRRLHYLKRREEIERHATYVADELDLLALYFQTSFSIGALEFSDRGFGIYGFSEIVAKSYDHEGRSPDFSLSVKESSLWRRLLTNLEQRKPVGWTRFGFRLCSISYKSQIKAGRELEKAFKKARRIRSGGAVHFGFCEGPPRHRNVLALSVGKSLSEPGIISHCNDAGAQAMIEADATSCLVIHHDFDAKPGDFRYIATMNRFRPPPSATTLAPHPPLS